MKEKRLTEKQLMGLIKQEENKLKSIQNNFMRLQNAYTETSQTIEAIKEIEKNPNKILMKIGSGVMVEVNIINTKKVTRAFSQKGYLDEEIKDTKKWLKEKQKDIENKMKETQKQVQKVREQLGSLIGVANKINEEKRKMSQQNIATK